MRQASNRVNVRLTLLANVILGVAVSVPAGLTWALHLSKVVTFIVGGGAALVVYSCIHALPNGSLKSRFVIYTCATCSSVLPNEIARCPKCDDTTEGSQQRRGA